MAPSGFNPRPPKALEQTLVAVTSLGVSGVLVGLVVWNRPECPRLPWPGVLTDLIRGGWHTASWDVGGVEGDLF